jgi:hypothetical protein
MATYDEIKGVYAKGLLREKIQVAVAIAAQEILGELDTVENHTERYAWAAKAFANPSAEATRFEMSVLAANKDAALSVIENATDAQIQTNVDAAVNLFALSDAA